MNAALSVLSRLCLAFIFVLSGFGKFTQLAGFAGMLASKHVPAPTAAAVIAGVVEVVGGILLIIGFRARWVAGILALYLIPTTVIGHVMGGPQMIEILKNVAIFGGLLRVVVDGGGPATLDRPVPAGSVTY